MPWWLSATALTIDSPRPEEPERSPCAAEEALEDLVVQLGAGCPARRPRRRARPAPLRALDAPRPPCRGRCGAARSPSGSARAGAARRARRRSRRPAGAEIEISWSPATGSSSAAASVTTLGEVDRAVRRLAARRPRARAAAGRRPGGASGGEERSAEAAASRCSPSSVSSSSSRLASTDVSGVRSSCEASATNSRWRASVASVSARASSSACSIESSVVGQLGDLVVGLRPRDARLDGRACASISRAAVGQLGDRLHRAARRRQAGQQRQRGAAEHAEAEEQLHAVRGRLHVARCAARTGRRADVVPGCWSGRRSRARASRPSSRRSPRSRSVGGPKFGASVERVEATAPVGGRRRGSARVGRRRERVERRSVQRVLRVARRRASARTCSTSCACSRSAARGDLAVEVLVDRARRQRADDHREAAAGSPASAPPSRRRGASGSAGAYTRST